MARSPKHAIPTRSGSGVRPRAVAAAIIAGAGIIAASSLHAVADQSLLGDIALGSSGPIFSQTAYLDELGRPTPLVEERVNQLAAQPWLPAEISETLRAGLAVGTGEAATGEGSPELLDPAVAPEIAQFAWPTVSGKCIGGTQTATGTALAVPGPSELPAPGAGANQTAFLFTALGTAPAAAEQGGMTVTWLNLDTLAFGETPLGEHGINPQGPATISGVADTGEGVVVAVLKGTVATTEGSCTFLPTAGVINAR
ncbi:Rv1157c family protein [Corynebacterium uterequi]|uniref:Secreted protein n=1 Tax=Corynebacterium uterequi TaxID=1072256 RepID=A0A0G3HBY8_9CORY|nr:hypothetical protein [Corynebacterium uterequi]AKK10814.1 hypothetical protein CUTER_04040 [Corynebacterium uterequi]